MDIILQPWPWYVCGPLMALIMYALLYSGKTFGMSSNLRTLCSMAGAGKTSNFFKIDWTIIGGFIAHFFLSSPTDIDLNPQTVSDLAELGFDKAGKTLLPSELYSWDKVFSLKGMSLLLIGGFLVGFGTRYAGGCTSGHAITGLSSLQLPSLIAVIGFFIGGLIMIHILFPLIF